MAPFIGACVKSLSWTDGIYLFDDRSTDDSAFVAMQYSEVPTSIEVSKNRTVAFRKGELGVRNYIVDKAFEKLGVDLLIIVDADELVSSGIKPHILKSFIKPKVDSMTFSTWHLYSKHKYIHFWETEINGIKLIDPHTRIIKKGGKFTPLFKDGGHPIIQPTKNTKCLTGPYHFHLKYYHLSTLPNYSLFFLPKFITKKDVSPYLRDLPFGLPSDIVHAMSLINWSKIPKHKNTPHYGSKRIKFNNPSEALTHPKDRHE